MLSWKAYSEVNPLYKDKPETIPERKRYLEARFKSIAFTSIRDALRHRNSQDIVHHGKPILSPGMLGALTGKGARWVTEKLQGPTDWDFETLAIFAAALELGVSVNVFPCERNDGSPENITPPENARPYLHLNAFGAHSYSDWDDCA